MRAPFQRFVLGSAAAFTLLLSAAGIAGAQSADPMAAPPPTTATPPTYATPIAGETINGAIVAVTGKYTLQLRDTRGYLDNVTLHQGTIINPRGLTLAAGMQVIVSGTNAGASFQANQIDAPYTVALVPGYGYGVRYGVGLGFAPGWGWGPRFRGGFWW